MKRKIIKKKESSVKNKNFAFSSLYKRIYC